MNILITGGAGYIGSHVAKQLIEEKKHSVTLLDNLSTGFQSAVDSLISMDSSVKFIRHDLSDWDKTEKLIKSGGYDAVIHFAASLIVPESVKEPLKYYINNTANTSNLVKCCVESGINRFIFSSTAAVYGEPENMAKTGLREDDALMPISPYGRSKLFSEYVVRDAGTAYPDFKYVILRYFNVAGASGDGLIGQSTLNATHLVKVAAQTALGIREKMFIYGGDYPTPDGTCVRDYIHVDDLASAHLCSLSYLDGGVSGIFNCGYGHGYSVSEVIDIMREVSGKDINAEMSGRRAGDPADLIADSRKIKDMTGWKPVFDDLRHICRTALDWETKLSNS
ncbi:MAG: UDP-glucose 4-epimerase GalE [Deferribacterales bacterium]